jgi:hypothetical protein
MNISEKMIFVLGLAGALAPEILRLYALRSRPEQFVWSWFYVVISLCFAGLGGLVALILPATTYWGAFYAGISAPTVITVALKKRTRATAVKAAGAAARRPHFSVFLDAL